MDGNSFLYDMDATIAALATPAGRGSVAMVRLSGKKALEISQKLFSRKIPEEQSHQLIYGELKHPDTKELIDSILLAYMKGPNSFTGEDVVEFYLHGNPLIAELLLQALFDSGAQAAAPGEFSKRAFLNKKVDLTQAEAIQELISARSSLALKAAQQHLKGALSEKIFTYQQELTELAAIIEAWVDYPEEDLEFTSDEIFKKRLDSLINNIQILVETYHEGRKISEGIRLCLLGIPNAGKSSLMNLLLDSDRAIVTDIPGTTRDTLEESFRLAGYLIRIIDTAGIRQTDGLIEQEGIKRSWKTSDQSDLNLIVLDATKGLCEEQKSLLEKAPLEKSIVVWNKMDLTPPSLPSLSYTTVCLSAKEKQGLAELHDAIIHYLASDKLSEKEDTMITSLRHQQTLKTALGSLKHARTSIEESVSPEFIAFDLRAALNTFGEMTGTQVEEKLLDSIFSQFCLGK